MNTHDKIELPPLRIPDLEDELTAVLCAAISWGGSVISSEEYVAAKQRFRAAVNAAIEADRKRQGDSAKVLAELVALIPLADTLNASASCQDLIDYFKGVIADRKRRGEVVVTKTPEGEIIAVTRQDDEGKILSVIAEADCKHHDRMLAHEWIRPSLGLDEDAPYRFDFYAQEIEKLKAELKKFERNGSNKENDNDHRKRRPSHIDPELKATIEDAAKTRSPVAITKDGRGVMLNCGDEEDRMAEHEAYACPYCGGSGHKDDVAEHMRRGDPVGYVMPTAIKQLKAGGNAVVGGVSQGGDVAVYLAPQPVDPDAATIADYEAVLSDHRRLVRELDILLNGEEGAAEQASLCDIVAQVRGQLKR